MRFEKALILAGWLVGVVALGAKAFAGEKNPQDPYVMPSSPPLYDTNVSLNQPGRVWLGGGVWGGQGFSSAHGARVNWGGYGEIGYRSKYISWQAPWNRYVRISRGQVGHADADLSMSGEIFLGISKGGDGGWFSAGPIFGVGVATADYTNTTNSGLNLRSNSPLLGSHIQLGYAMYSAMDEHWELDTEFSYNYWNFLLTGTTDQYGDISNQKMNISFSSLQVGFTLRYLF